jgi:hypothetical protein
VTPAGEKFCEILRQISSGADRDKSKPLSKSVLGGQKSPPRLRVMKRWCGTNPDQYWSKAPECTGIDFSAGAITANPKQTLAKKNRRELKGRC